MSSSNYGRAKILTDIVLNGSIDHDKALIPKILESALPIHTNNCTSYTRNEQWYFNDTNNILTKVKHIRPEIDNKFTFATAKSTVNMNNGYCFGAGFKFVCNESDKDLQKEMQAFNKCLTLVNYNKHMFECANNGAKFGISYKLAVSPTKEDIANGKYFDIVSDINNFNTFVVYSNDIKKEEVLGVVFYDRVALDESGNPKSEDANERVFNCWTKWHRWVFIQPEKDATMYNTTFSVPIANSIVRLEAFPLNLSFDGVAQESMIPLQEFQRTSDRVGDYELSIKLMDAINILACCRVDSVQQSTDFIIKLRDIDLGEFDDKGNNPVLDRIEQYMRRHFLAFDSVDGASVQPDVDVLDIPLNQSEVQTLQDYLWTMLEQELQQPLTDGGAGKDTGIAVENRNGFRQFENLAVQITDEAIAGERQFLAKLLEIAKSYPDCPFKNLKASDIDINTMRNKSENTTNSTNNFREMRKAGVNPYTAYAISGLVADINDTVAMDEDWKQKEKDFELENQVKATEEMNKVNPPQNGDNNKKVDGPKTE